MDPLILILVLGSLLIFGLLIAGIVVARSGQRTLVEERLGQYLEEEQPAAKRRTEKSSPLGDWLDSRMEGSKWTEGIAKELARADVKLKPVEYLASMIISAFGAGFVAWYLGGMSILFGLIGAFFGLFLPKMYIGKAKGKRLVLFSDQLPDMLNLMVNGLRAGYSTMQAMEAVSKEMPSPICDEFRRVVQEMQLGIPMERALDNLLRRIPSEDLDLVITAVNVQREVGGNLAEILDTISYTIRERVRVKGEIRVMTSQVMYSGRFLAIMPILIAAILFLMNRSYMMEFFNPETRIPGIIALVVAALMVITGYFVMVKIASIDV
jgi:tight adherence protein B